MIAYETIEELLADAGSQFVSVNFTKADGSERQLTFNPVISRTLRAPASPPATLTFSVFGTSSLASGVPSTPAACTPSVLVAEWSRRPSEPAPQPWVVHPGRKEGPPHLGGP